jgi:hypothetical protein
MASLLVVASVFIGLWTLYFTVREAGLIRETELPIHVETLAERAYARGGRGHNCGFL